MTDIEYKQKLLKSLGLDPKNYHILDSVMGKDEFTDYLKENSQNPSVYTPEEDFTNVKNKTFASNFHIHTTNSDGLMTVERLLNLAAQYGEAMAKHTPGKKFYFAITDHNTTNGDIEALKIIAQNPKKYKNIRVALGIEASAQFDSKTTGKSSEVHLLSYGLNPFTDKISILNEKRLSDFQNRVGTAIANANEYYRQILHKYGFRFSFSGMARIRPSIKTCPSNVRYSLKDYLQFRLIYADMVEINPKLKAYLLKHGVKLDSLDFSIPKSMIVEGKERPYWKNYVTMLAQYLNAQVNKPNGTEIPKLLGNVTDETLATLESLEKTPLDPAKGLYITEPPVLSFEEVTNAFKNSSTAVSGIAHGALYEKGQPHQHLFLQELYSRFKSKFPRKKVIGERFYPYRPDEDNRYVNGLIQLYGYLPSGGLDSHKNNFFTPQTSYNEAILKRLINPARSVEYKKKTVEDI